MSHNIKKNHLPYLCKYNKLEELPATAYARCSGLHCQEFLCPMCGYKDVDEQFCNECWKNREEKQLGKQVIESLDA